MTPESSSSNVPTPAQTAHDVLDVKQTTCCIVGGGPGGAVLALLLARQGINVMLLEAHEDFDRDFRGDTIHPSVLEIMDELGLAERLLQLRHSKIYTGTFMTPTGPLTVADFRRLRTRFPFIAMLPQVHFLEFLTEEAKRYPNFQLLMGASAQELVEEDGAIKGIRYRAQDGWHELRAVLTIGADGRSSHVRRLAGLVPIKTSPPMDVLWFRLSRLPGDPAGLLARFGRGHMMVMLDRLDQWQVAYVILKGASQQIHAAGLDALRQSIVDLAPELASRVQGLKDWKDVATLNVESSRVSQWYLPGLLLIGDAAHVMSPVGGVGINYAIQDAVAASNRLSASLKRGAVTVDDLRAVQRRREWPTRFIQRIQALVQRIIGNALGTNQTLKPPLLLRLLLRVPLLRDVPARVIAFGFWPVHLKK